ncbi:MAG: MATE family efflux transporter, partial [Pseudomonadota bacterium]
MTQSAAKFLQGDLMHHVVVMSLSASIGLVSIFLVDFVDLFFIALLGEAALAAAVGFAGTLLYFTFAI